MSISDGRCPICGGATTCPANDYAEVWAGEAPAYPLRYSHGDRGHRSPDTSREPPLPPGWTWEFIRSRQSGRIRAHYPEAQPQWVSQCTYALAVRRIG